MDNSNYSPHSSYPDSNDSSPLSREIDCDNSSWDDSPSRVKFMCSYGGKITPRPHDNQLSYVGGDTKILTVDRTIRFPAILSKLSSLLHPNNNNNDIICFKYQLPGEDLDALISVTNDEDLDHMMLEYDRLHRRLGSAKPARLRLFLFPLNPLPPPPQSDPKLDRQWFVDALNSPPIQTNSTIIDRADGDFLFGLDQDVKNSEDPVVDPIGGGDFEFSTVEINRQIQELHRMQIASQEREILQQNTATSPPAQPPGSWLEKQVSPGGGFPAAPATGADHPVYMVPTPMYRPAAAGQGYYVQRAVPGVYQEAPLYGPPPVQKVGPQVADVAGGGGYVGVAYDSTGRQVYYNAPVGVMPTYQTVSAAAGVVLSQEGKVSIAKPQSS